MLKMLKTRKIKLAQLRNVAILLGFVAMIITGYMCFSDASSKPAIANQKDNFANPLDHVDPESIVLERTQKKLDDTQKKSELAEQQIKALMEANKDVLEKLNATEQKLDGLQKEVSSHSSTPSMDVAQNSQLMAGSQAFQGDFLPTSTLPQGYSGGIEPGIREDNLSLSAREASLEERLPLKNPDTYVPPGTFVKAVMIGGADASAAVNSQINPTPMLFRIIANGTLPNHKKSHLKDCMVTAAVVGDISSERGMIRLESLSCTFPTNEVVDQSVEGTIFGPEGKNGVRGRPIWREAALLQRAFAAGTLSGISNGISQSYTSNSISPEGAVQSINPGKVFQYGVANGTGKAMDKLADYNIQRAEQYHPVIQLSAGTVVDVVFLKGFFLDGKKHEAHEVSSRPEASENTPTLFPEPPMHEEGNTLPLSVNDVKRIQEKSKELGLRVTHQPSIGYSS